MDTLYQLLEWNPVQVGSTFQGGGVYKSRDYITACYSACRGATCHLTLFVLVLPPRSWSSWSSGPTAFVDVIEELRGIFSGPPVT